MRTRRRSARSTWRRLSPRRRGARPHVFAMHSGQPWPRTHHPRRPERSLPGDLWADDLDAIVVPAGAVGGPATMARPGHARSWSPSRRIRARSTDAKLKAEEKDGVIVALHMEALDCWRAQQDQSGMHDGRRGVSARAGAEGDSQRETTYRKCPCCRMIVRDRFHTR